MGPARGVSSFEPKPYINILHAFPNTYRENDVGGELEEQRFQIVYTGGETYPPDNEAGRRRGRERRCE